MSDPRVSLKDLERIVAERAQVADGSSYTRTLLDKGLAKCAQKLGEESVETVVAAVSGAHADLVAEASDLLYHLAVLLHARGVSVDEVEAELARRTHQSGLAEKASRG